MKKTHLISFLGKVIGGGEYRYANYQIDTKHYHHRFFGLALAEHHQPDQMVILGTSGSMWDVLIESQATDNQWEAERIALIEAAQQNQVTQAQLDELEPYISEQIGIPTQLQLIPYGMNEADQMAIVHSIAQHIQAGDHAIMDLTHGLRHLPMLGMFAAIYLQGAKNVTIDGIYTGALDMTDSHTGITPVLNLTGLLSISRWTAALNVYDHSGDYATFSPLIQNAQTSQVLNKASFLERTNNTEQAKQQLASIDKQLNDELQRHPMSSLFADALLSRLTWYKAPSRGEREIRLASNYLAQEDYLRAAIMGFEGYITLQLEKAKENPHDFQSRKALSDDHAAEDDRLKMLRAIRNALAHGLRPTHPKIIKIMAEQRTLHETLAQLFQGLLRK